MFSGHGNLATGLFVGYTEATQLVLSGSNIIAILTGTNGDTILLIRIGNMILKVYPGSRPG